MNPSSQPSKGPLPNIWVAWFDFVVLLPKLGHRGGQ